MYLDTLPKRKNRIEKGKRKGRGYGSGKGGHTVGRGTKGQKSRSGHKSLISFEGGNLPFYKRIPKSKGFKSRALTNTQVINVSTLDTHFDSGTKITIEVLGEKGLVRKNSTDIKILGKGEVDKKFVVEGIKVSPSAREKIEKAGGTVK
jgi:large subunit ribosomal protein L15